MCFVYKMTNYYFDARDTRPSNYPNCSPCLFHLLTIYFINYVHCIPFVLTCPILNEFCYLNLNQKYKQFIQISANLNAELNAHICCWLTHLIWSAGVSINVIIPSSVTALSAHVHDHFMMMFQVDKRSSATYIFIDHRGEKFYANVCNIFILLEKTYPFVVRTACFCSLTDGQTHYSSLVSSQTHRRCAAPLAWNPTSKHNTHVVPEKNNNSFASPHFRSHVHPPPPPGFVASQPLPLHSIERVIFPPLLLLLILHLLSLTVRYRQGQPSSSQEAEATTPRPPRSRPTTTKASDST